MLRREWRAGELKVLAAALIIAVASVSSVGFFTDRMERAMESGATELLGADLLLYSRTPIDEQEIWACGSPAQWHFDRWW